MKLFLSLAFLFFTTLSHAQIIAPDTVQVNTPVTFSTSHTGISYAWSTDAINTLSITTIGKPLYSWNFNTMTEAVMEVENGNYIGFVLNQSGELLRLAFGTSPNNNPIIYSLGSFGVMAYNAQGLDIVYDNNNWYGLIANANYLIRLDFGNSLSNTPVATIMDFSPDIWYPMQISIIRTSANEVYAFAGHFGMNSILRFDFGASLTNTPTLTIITNNSALQNVCNFTLYNEANTWYMLATNLTGHTLSLITLGAAINNNNPAMVNLGNLNNHLSNPRFISLFPGCNNLYGIIGNQGGGISQLDFNGSVTNTPLVTNFTLVPNISGMSYNYPYWYNDTLFMMVTNFDDNSLRTLDLQVLPPNSVNQTGSFDTFTHTFTTPGVYDISVQIDQAQATGPTTFCKTLVVVNGTNSVRENLSGKMQLYPNPSYNGIINIRAQEMEAREVEIQCISSTGVVVFSKLIPVMNNSLNTSIDLSSFSKGIYGIKLNAEGKIYTDKIIVE